MKIRKGDNVLITKGKDRGKTGKVLAVAKDKNKILIEGRNLVIKHVKPKKQGEKGQKVQIPHPIYISKVKLVCPKCSKAVRIRYQVNKKGKDRVCKKCEKSI